MDPDAVAEHAEAVERAVADAGRLAVVRDLALPGHVGLSGLDGVVTALHVGTDVPIAVINIVSPDLQTFPAEIGVGAGCTQVPDHLSFCAEVVATGEPLQVADAAAHEVYRDNPLVEAGVVSSYLGVPLRHQGAVVGTVSVFDERPRDFGDADLALLQAMSEVTEALLALHQAAHRDPVTGLLDRRRLELVAAEALTAGPVSLLLADVDRFAEVDATAGPAVADRLLTEIADALTTSTRRYGAAVGRWRSDQFLVVLPGADYSDARRAAETVQAALAEGVGREVPGVTVRLGAASRPTGTAWAELLRDASDACRSAGRAGPGAAVTWSETLRRQARLQADFETDLRRDVAAGSLTLEYQPVLDLRDGTVGSVEALVRWRRGGVAVRPDEFIALAEESDLILDIGAHVLDTACSQAAVWRAHYPAGRSLTVWVNVSGRELDQPGYAGRTLATIARHGLPPGAIGVEVTETAASLDRDGALDALHALRAGGVPVALDDFGTGQSSLGQLRRLPVDRLKLDRTFVAGLDARDARGTAYVRAVIELARALGLGVVAEGVETETERATLVGLGCRAIQGYLFARPQPPHALPALLDWGTGDAAAPDLPLPRTPGARGPARSGAPSAQVPDRGVEGGS